MDRENNLINQRITWALVFSGGIFTASAILISVISGLKGWNTQGEDDYFRAILFLIAAALAAGGVYFSYRTREGVKAAHSQLEYLKHEYQRQRGRRQRSFEETYGWPRPFGDPDDHLRGNAAAMTFPVLLLWAWLFIGLIEFGLFCVFATHGYDSTHQPVASPSQGQPPVGPAPKRQGGSANP